MIQSESTASMWSSRRVLVTGAEGFVARWLIRALVNLGASVIGLHRPHKSGEIRQTVERSHLQFVAGDLTDLQFLSNLIRKSDIDTVFHLAASNVNTGKNLSPYIIFESNTRGVYTVFEACLNAPKPVHVILASSKEVQDSFDPVKRRKQHPYMTSKASAELIARAYHDSFEIPMTLVRSDNIYGGGDLNWARLVPGTFRTVLAGKQPIIRSDGLLRRDYVYIEDAVAAFIAIGEKIRDPEVNGQLFRIATGQCTSVLDLVLKIVAAAGCSDLEPIILNQNQDERTDSFYSPDFENEVLRWRPRFSIESGIAHTCDWYRAYFAAEDPE